MRIVTLNTWKNEGHYLRRLELMGDGLQELAPDIVCLQECFAAEGFDTAGWLASKLGLVAHQAPSRRKVRTQQGRDLDSTSGLAILARAQGLADRLDLASHPADGDRIAQRLDLEVEGRPLRILNLHLTHLRRADALRAQQLAQALAWAGEGLAGGLVVAGDLNAGAADAALAPLRLRPRPPTLQGARVGEAPVGLAAIDHCVLHRPGPWREAAALRGLDTPDAEGWYPSDHAAVGLDLV
ncbi:endonuclease/exonuclease/phosphatase family protein [Phenylobacterium sp.]|uniref:endonuclease/exonuclease/phosphatase family protein n=1 Tax=Phenylobacterium sp. TaxID=1871053 RepID=UPI00271FDED1|nr:endonuclease/exonuclease/phosphatase family protein [Phenylobacterium sp.]MDO8802362.1 endonuclease/exonuclease/phosphatase family protein [Phenylobacterium sp.]